ncbi:MAG: M48 family metalloprotease [Gemmatimonadales bacterium]|nr:M48 family metalloprotease [Gemmatimonadales bacterium]MDZ4390945.1 M48 family metalloprotease [Gemmatimonadales bacterium]
MINSVKTFVLLAGMISICLLAGQVLGGSSGLLLGGSIGMIMAFVSFWFSDTMVLKGYKARVVTAEQAPELYALVDELRQRAGLPMPRVAIMASAQPNAFATGRSWDKAVVAVTEGLLRSLPRDELAGVIAHELAHIKNRDMLISTVAAGIAAMLSYLPYIMLFGGGRRNEGGHPFAQIAIMLLGPIAAGIMQMAISRQREFLADRTGAEILGQAKPLAQALTRLDAMARQIPMDVAPAFAPLAQVNPLRGGGMNKLFSTHPATEDRVRALLALDAGR